MRTVKMIATKDHFLFVVKTIDIEETLHVATEYPKGNPIGFLVEGDAISFKKDTLEDSDPWVKYGERLFSPNLHIRSLNSLLGGVSATESATYVSVVPRDAAQIDDWENLCIKYHVKNFATEDEIIKIQDPATAIQLGTPWITNAKRELDTFELIEDNTIEEIPISDDEIVFNFGELGI